MNTRKPAYRGKYPNHIQSIWSGALVDFNRPELGHSFWGRTNDGRVFWIDKANSAGVMPKPGADVTAYEFCHIQD